MEEQPKIIVDSDWKNEAQKEKEQLAQQESTNEEIPEPHFMEIVNVLVVQASAFIAGAETSDGHVVEPDPMMAKRWIELLAILREKTQNNLDKEEEEIFDTALHNLHMGLVQTFSGIMPHEQ